MITGSNFARGTSLRTQALSRFVRKPVSVVCLSMVVLMVVISVLAGVTDLVENHSPAAQDLDSAFSGPSAAHWLGTDNLGRDLWARVWEGVRISLRVAIAAQVLILVIGITVGTLCIVGGRTVDNLLMRFTDAMYAFPELLAILLARAVLRDQTWPIIGSGDPQLPFFQAEVLQVVLAIAFVGWVTLARLVRGELLALRERDYVTAAVALGASPARVVYVHMLPNTLGPIIVSVTFGIPAAIFAEATLGYLGIGVPLPTASLGVLVEDGFRWVRESAWMMTVPALAIATLMICFTFIGDGLRDSLDPRSRR